MGGVTWLLALQGWVGHLPRKAVKISSGSGVFCHILHVTTVTTLSNVEAEKGADENDD